MSVSFDVYPRRVVSLPGGGHALVVVRRNVDAKFNALNGWDLRWELAQLRRILGRDRRWRVELYDGISEDPQGTPKRAADREWILADKRSSSAFAERLAHHLQRGDGEPLPEPLS